MKDRIIFAFYTFSIRLADIYLSIAANFDDKIRKLTEGRVESLRELEKNTNTKFKGKCVWFHCASLGEFEQGRPLIEKLKKMHPDVSVYLSFFSPSGYEIRKDYPFADYVFYLPSDLPENAARIIHFIKPDIVVFVKYEFWWNILKKLHSKKIPVFLISGVFRKDQYFFKSVFGSFRNILADFTKIFTQDSFSSEVLDQNGIYNSIIAGDTRIDRVAELSKTVVLSSKLKDYTQDKTVIIYGSIWESDMGIISDYIKNSRQNIHIIAPHDIKPDNITRLEKYLSRQPSLYSDEKWNSNILFINNIGLLNQLYSCANVAYVGGGFQAGIHNILEPAVFGIPVIFGTEYQKFREAVEMVELEVAYSVKSKVEFTKTVISLLDDNLKLKETDNKLRDYIKKNIGASDKILEYLELQLFKTQS